MFEVGKSYSFTVDGPDGLGTSSYQVVAWEAPLLTLAALHEPNLILNTGSARFLSAKPVDFDATAPMDISAFIKIDRS